MGSAYRRGSVWWVKYRDAGGATRRESTTAHTGAEAKALLRELEARAFRQERGLEPLTLNPEGWTLGDLMCWWLEQYSSRSSGHGSNKGTVRSQILSVPLADKKLEQVKRGDVEALLVAKEREGLSPQTVNHIRAFLVRAFNRAKKADKWLGGNPAEETDTRRVPERIVDILTADEVLPFFGALVPAQRPLFAAAILTGLRKGELCGLRKDDLDLGRRLLFVRHTYDQPFPKSKRQRVVRVPEELVPFLEHALANFPGPWLFPDPEGAMRARTWQPEDVFRRALKRAGIVTGYRHKCRRRGCGHEEQHPDATPRACPMCGMKLWPKGQVRSIRFHDLRHTYASVLLMLGANLVSVQKLLGHSDPKITERRYGHMLPEFMSAEVNRLRFGLDRLAPRGSASQSLAAPVNRLGTIWAQSESPEEKEAGTPRISPRDPGLLGGGEYGTRTRGLRRDRPAL